MQTGDCEDELLAPPLKFLIKQPSKGEASFRVLYYGGAAGTVPFTWETSPGTPKHPLFEENSLPPLTPPPSYLSTPKTNNKSGKSKISEFDLFTKSESTSEKALFSSSSSSNSVPSRNLYARSGNRLSRSIVHYSFEEEDDDEKAPESMPALCFGGLGGSGNRSGAGGISRMFRRVKNAKNKIQ